MLPILTSTCSRINKSFHRWVLATQTTKLILLLWILQTSYREQETQGNQSSWRSEILERKVQVRAPPHTRGSSKLLRISFTAHPPLRNRNHPANNDAPCSRHQVLRILGWARAMDSWMWDLSPKRLRKNKKWFWHKCRQSSRSLIAKNRNEDRTAVLKVSKTISQTRVGLRKRIPICLT